MTLRFRMRQIGTVLLLALAPFAASAASPAAHGGVNRPLLADIVYRTLDNGLKVVLAPDRSIPTATIGVYYHIGFRNEPGGRTGFAHLFEHLMFQGSAHVPKGAFDGLINGNGGVLNGSTRFDYTNYYEVVPSNVTEAVLWAEADRMKALALAPETLKNQQDVVINEVKQNVLNQPYGGFPWLDLPQVAFTNWYNAHNFYGDLEDIEAATLEDAQAFRAAYYAPGNAVVVVAGDIDVATTLTWIERYFGAIPRGPAVERPDTSEPPQTMEKHGERLADRVPRPALAIAYRVPERFTPEWFAMGLIDSVLTDGDDGLLVQKLVREKGYTAGLMSGINVGLGSMFTYEGPMLWTVGMVHDMTVWPHQIQADTETVLGRLRDEPLDQAAIDRARTRMRSSLYDVIGSPTRFGLVDLLACFALFDNDPARINTLESGFDQVTPALVQQTARAWLTPEQRITFEVQPVMAVLKPTDQIAPQGAASGATGTAGGPPQ